MIANLKIVSGGQTGVDQGALEAAARLGLEFGGWARQPCGADRICLRWLKSLRMSAAIFAILCAFA